MKLSQPGDKKLCAANNVCGKCNRTCAIFMAQRCPLEDDICPNIKRVPTKRGIITTCSLQPNKGEHFSCEGCTK